MSPVRSEVIRLFLLLSFPVFLAVLTTGCSTASDPENQSQRPWGAPKGFESGLPSSMTEGR